MVSGLQRLARTRVVSGLQALALADTSSLGPRSQRQGALFLAALFTASLLPAFLGYKWLTAPTMACGG